MTVFETERLRARALTPDDAEPLFGVYGDPDVTRYVTTGGQHAPSVDVIKVLLTQGMLAPGPDPRFGFWALERHDGTFLGTVALVLVEDTTDEYELGWHLARAHWGRGYAVESGVALIHYAFEVAGLDRVLALAHPDNERSLRACARIGMTQAGRRMNNGYEHACFVAERATWAPPLMPVDGLHEPGA